MGVTLAAHALLGCGGDPAPFDEQGVRDAVAVLYPERAADVDELVDAARGSCETLSDEAIALAIDGAADRILVDLVRVGCRERYDAAVGASRG